MARGQFFFTGNPQKQLDEINKLTKRAFGRVSAGVLNTQAFTARTGFQETLRKDNTIRTPSLLRKATRVKKARITDPVARQQSQSGSIRTARHDAWAAIDQGENVEATTFTHAGRVGNDESGKSRKAVRAGQSRTTQMSDFQLSGSGERRVVMYLQEIAKDKALRRKPFFLPMKFKRMNKGIYKFKGGRHGTFTTNGRKYKDTLVNPKIVRLSGPDSKFRAKKTNWNERTIKREITSSMLDRMWKKQMSRELGKIKKR